jgi:hypothetical protein
MQPVTRDAEGLYDQTCLVTKGEPSIQIHIGLGKLAFDVGPFLV